MRHMAASPQNAAGEVKCSYVDCLCDLTRRV